MMAGLWYLTPVWGLLIFVVTSAWHFGQTDFEHWRIHKHPVFTMLLRVYLYWLGSLVRTCRECYRDGTPGCTSLGYGCQRSYFLMPVVIYRPVYCIGCNLHG